MRIAIIGAPGSGKSALADKLATKLEIPKVDSYVDQYEKRTGIALGYLADLVPNLMCATERLAAEYATLQESGEDYVICGTTIESAAYASIRAVENMSFVDDKAAERQRVRAAMDALTMLLENWNYDHVFYLPLAQKHEDQWDKRLDANIGEALTILGIDHTPLTGEDPFADALAAIEER